MYIHVVVSPSGLSAIEIVICPLRWVDSDFEMAAQWSTDNALSFVQANCHKSGFEWEEKICHLRSWW